MSPGKPRPSVHLPHSGGSVSGRADLVAQAVRIDGDMAAQERAWIDQLRAEWFKAAHPDDTLPRIDRVIQIRTGPGAWLRRLLRRDPKIKVLPGAPMQTASLTTLDGAKPYPLGDLHLADLLVSPREHD